MITLKMSVQNWDRIKDSLALVRGRIIPTMIKTARRGVWLYVVPPTINAIAQQSGIGRTIWGRDPSGLKRVVRQGELLMHDPHWGRTSLRLRGIPAMLEDGGRIKPHMINNPFGRKGTMLNHRYVSGGMWHPGMVLRAYGFGQGAMDRGMGAIQTDVDVALGEMMRRNGL